jgi:hypothetical protein
MKGKTGGKKGKKPMPMKKGSDKPMSHGEKHKGMMDRIQGDPEC